MNKCIFMGRAVTQPELKYTQSGVAVAKFAIAVDGYKKDDVTFVDVVCWRKTAEFVANWVEKGKRVLVVTQLKINSYEKDGQKRRSYEFHADNVEVVDWPEKGQQEPEGEPAGFDDVPF